MSHLVYIRIFLISALFPIGILACVNYLIDPYEVFQTGLFDEVGATQERYLKIEYLKKNKEFDTFLLGGSRIGTTNPTDLNRILPNSNIYNFFVSSGNQTDNLLHGLWLIRNQPKIKTLYVQVDWPESIGSFYESYQYKPHPEIIGNKSVGYLTEFLFLVPFDAISFKIQNNTHRIGEYKLSLQSGNYYYPKRDFLLQTDCSGYVAQTPSLIKPVEQESASLDQANLIKKSLSTLKILVEEANAHKVQIFLYVTPHNHHFLDKINLDLYLFFLKSLSDIAPFWNFGFYSDFTVNDCNYYESSHYAPHSAPLIFQAMNSLQNSLIAHRVSSNSIASEIIFIKDNFRAHKNR